MAKGTDIVKSNAAEVIPERIQAMIHIIRGERVILDRDLAALYQVETKNLKRQVKRNIERFPSDFMMELSREEYQSLWCQNGTLEHGRGAHSKYLPYAFTENGVAMLSSVLTSEVAINTNIQIMRAFTMMRRTLSAISQTAMRQDKLEIEVENLRNYVENILHDQNDMNEELASQVEAVSQSLAELCIKVEEVTSRPAPKRAPIGYEAIAEREEK
ncbi:MAG: ORF6N domain-containing protein [Bacteroidales bacterium]|nr:ORF6N domain-containing protein [Candidatus Colicola equi]